MLVLAYGVVVPAGLLYAMRSFTATMRSMNLLTFALPFAWFVLIAVGILLLARRFMVPTDIVLGAGGLGTFVGFWVFSNVVGWGLEMVAIGAFALLAVVLGGWGGYEWNRYHGTAMEPRYGTWRTVFVLLGVTISTIPVVLVVV